MIPKIDTIKNRHLLPRLVPTAVKRRRREIREERKNDYNSIMPNFIDEKYNKFKYNNNIESAFDLVLECFVVGNYDLGIEAAKYIKKNIVNSELVLLNDIVNIVLGNDNIEVYYGARYDLVHDYSYIAGRIREMRRLLTIDVRNPTVWSDMAIYYSILGLQEKSLRMMKNAVLIAPNNRYICRLTASLYEYYEKPGEALYILRKNANIRNDPWLLAADISIAQRNDRKQLFYKIAKNIIESRNYSSAYLTELLGALGTYEISTDRKKLATRHIKESAFDPTENSLAQAVWAYRRYGINFDNTSEQLENSYEAKARNYYYEQEWNKCLEAIEGWIHYQPMHKEPILLGSFIASVVLEKYDIAIKMLSYGLRANKTNVIIANNLAYAYGMSNNAERAQEILNRIDERGVEKDTRAVITATRGLVDIMKGNEEEGKSKYDKAISHFELSNNREMAALATYSKYITLKQAKAKSDYPKDSVIEILQNYYKKPEVDRMITILNRMLS